MKQHSDTPVIQPTRVRDVVTSRRQQAIEAGVDADFAEQLFRVLLTETHRIEVAGHRPDPAPDKQAAGAGSVRARHRRQPRRPRRRRRARSRRGHRLAGRSGSASTRCRSPTRTPGMAAVVGRRRHVRARQPGGLARRRPLRGTPRRRRAARRARGAQRRLRPRLPRRRRRAAAHRGGRRRRRPRAVLRRRRPGHRGAARASSPAPATGWAWARPTCWPCSTRSTTGDSV